MCSTATPAFWIGSHYSDNLQSISRGATGLPGWRLQPTRSGRADEDALSHLGRQCAGLLGLARKDYTATKTREIGRVSGYEKAGIEVADQGKN